MLESPQVGATLMGPNSTSDMEMGDQLGTLEPSKLADIVLVDGNPLEGYWNLLRAKATINEGKIVADHRWRTSFSGWGHMHCAAAVIVAIVWFGAAFTAQEFPTGNATVLAFDVVSIKSLAGIARARMPGARRSQGRFARASATLRQLAEYAYYVQPL